MATTDKKKHDDGGEAQVQAVADDAQEKGFIGTVPDQPANREYSLESGPEAPDEFEVARKFGRR